MVATVDMASGRRRHYAEQALEYQTNILIKDL